MDESKLTMSLKIVNDGQAQGSQAQGSAQGSAWHEARYIAHFGLAPGSALGAQLVLCLKARLNSAWLSPDRFGDLLKAGSARDSAYTSARLDSRPGSGSVSGSALFGTGLVRFGSVRASARNSTRLGLGFGSRLGVRCQDAPGKMLVRTRHSFPYSAAPVNDAEYCFRHRPDDSP